MRPSCRLLAQASAAGSTNAGLRPALALLPPIPLYRRLFRAHRRHLPAEMRLLGDEYIKAEFRSHRETENPAHIVSGLNCYKDGGRSEIRRVFTFWSMEKKGDGKKNIQDEKYGRADRVFFHIFVRLAS